MSYNFEKLNNEQKKYVTSCLLKQYKTALKREEFFSSQRSEEYENADKKLAYYNKITGELYDILKVINPKDKTFLDLNKKFEVEEE